MSQATNNSTKHLIRWMVAGYLAVPAAAWVLFEAILKETSAFWRNDGGWSVGFRQWVLYTFYPSFFLMAAFLLYLSIGGMRHFKFIKNHPIISVSPLLFAWIVLAATGIVVVTDNFGNLMTGQALHAP